MKIAIKLPDELRERMLAFPFLHGLEQILDDLLEGEDDVSQLHLISFKEDIDVLNLLPFHAFYHELESVDLKNIFSMHRACKNFKMNEIDLFISLTDKFVDASIGKNLKATRRLGFDHGKNNLFLKEKIIKNQAFHRAEQIYQFIKCLDKDARNIKSINSRMLPALFSDWSENPYITINLDLVEDEINEEWIDFLDLFVGEKFIFLCSELGADFQKSKIDDFIGKLTVKNEYSFFEYKSNIELGKLLSYSVCFITNDSPLYLISTYCGCHTFLLNTKEDLRNMGSQFFIGKLRHFDKSDPAFSHDGNFSYNKIFDELYDFIEAKTKPAIVGDD